MIMLLSDWKKDIWQPSGWWFQPTPLKNDGLRQLG
jgi:hypothetical protein